MVSMAICESKTTLTLLPNSAQAKPKLNFNLAELALFSETPTTPTHPGKFISKAA